MRSMTAAAPQRRSLIHVTNSAFAIIIGIGCRSSPGSNRAQACRARRVPGKLSRGRSKGNALGPHCATVRAIDWGAPVRHNSCRYATIATSKARGSLARSDADGRPVTARNVSKPVLATARVEIVLGRTPPSMRRTSGRSAARAEKLRRGGPSPGYPSVLSKTRPARRLRTCQARSDQRRDGGSAGLTSDAKYRGARYTSAAKRCAAKRRRRRFMRRELERPLATAPQAAWLSRKATMRWWKLEAERQRRVTKPTSAASSRMLI